MQILLKVGKEEKRQSLLTPQLPAAPRVCPIWNARLDACKKCTFKKHTQQKQKNRNAGATSSSAKQVNKGFVEEPYCLQRSESYQKRLIKKVSVLFIKVLHNMFSTERMQVSVCIKIFIDNH